MTCIENLQTKNMSKEKKLLQGKLTQTSGLSLGLHQAQNIVFSDWSLDVSDNSSGSIVQELNSNLGDTTSRTGSSKNLDNLCECDRSFGILWEISNNVSNDATL